MKLKTLKDADIQGKRVILRVAYDVPLEKTKKGIVVADDTRIRATLPTIRYLLRKKCSLVIITWLGRPGGKVVEELKLDPIANTLSALLHKPLQKLNGWDLPAHALKSGDIAMAENVRFSPDEEAGKERFAKELASLGDVIVFDAFAQSHRDTPSTTGLLKLLPSVVGFDMEKELVAVESLLKKPRPPFVVILGGAKISDKLETLRYLLQLADVVLVGGAMIHHFLKAQGIAIGKSRIEDEPHGAKKLKQKSIAAAEAILKETAQRHIHLGKAFNLPKLVLPVDLIAANKAESGAQREVFNLSDASRRLPLDWMYLDIGPETVKLFSSAIEKAKTIFWNGPLGFAEVPDFARGTESIAKAVAKAHALTIVGGGDTERIVKRLRLGRKFNLVSTGGGALLEMMAGKELPVLRFLKKE